MAQRVYTSRGQEFRAVGLKSWHQKAFLMCYIDTVKYRAALIAAPFSWRQNVRPGYEMGGNSQDLQGLQGMGPESKEV